MKKKNILIGIFIIVILSALIIIKRNNKPIIIISENNLTNITGAVNVKYKIYKNGDIYIDLHRNKDIEYERINEHTFQKNISADKVEDIKEKLQNINDSEYCVDNLVDSEWKYQINNSVHYVKNINIYQYVLEQYLDENYDQTINERKLENSIHDFIKKNYATNQSTVYSGPFNMFSLTDEEMNIILKEYKKENENIEYSDDELLKIIKHQSLTIWYESMDSLIKSN